MSTEFSFRNANNTTVVGIRFWGGEKRGQCFDWRVSAPEFAAMMTKGGYVVDETAGEYDVAEFLAMVAQMNQKFPAAA